MVSLNCKDELTGLPGGAMTIPTLSVKSDYVTKAKELRHVFRVMQKCVCHDFGCWINTNPLVADQHTTTYSEECNPHMLCYYLI